MFKFIETYKERIKLDKIVSSYSPAEEPPAAEHAIKAFPTEIIHSLYQKYLTKRNQEKSLILHTLSGIEPEQPLLMQTIDSKVIGKIQYSMTTCNEEAAQYELSNEEQQLLEEYRPVFKVPIFNGPIQDYNYNAIEIKTYRILSVHDIKEAMEELYSSFLKQDILYSCTFHIIQNINLLGHPTDNPQLIKVSEKKRKQPSISK